MTHKIAYLTLSIALVASPLFAASEYERQLSEITAQRDKAISEASEPINRRYQASLETLLHKVILSNDMEAAVKIKAALASLDPHALGWRFRGRWTDPEKASRLQFTAGNGFQENWNGNIQEGRWQATSDTDAKVTLKNGTVHNYHISDDGKSIKRLNDGYNWNREN